MYLLHTLLTVMWSWTVHNTQYTLYGTHNPAAFRVHYTVHFFRSCTLYSILILLLDCANVTHGTVIMISNNFLFFLFFTLKAFGILKVFFWNLGNSIFLHLFNLNICLDHNTLCKKFTLKAVKEPENNSLQIDFFFLDYNRTKLLTITK